MLNALIISFLFCDFSFRYQHLTIHLNKKKLLSNVEKRVFLQLTTLTKALKKILMLTPSQRIYIL